MTIYVLFVRNNTHLYNPFGHEDTFETLYKVNISSFKKISVKNKLLIITYIISDHRNEIKILLIRFHHPRFIEFLLLL